MCKSFSYFLILFIFVFNVSAQNVAVDRRAQVALKGNWIVESISFLDLKQDKINLLGIADAGCMEGSIWRFDANFKSGAISIVKADCKSYNTAFTWKVNEDNFLILMLQNSKKEEYLKLINQSKISFQLVYNLYQSGKSSQITYQFRKKK